MMEDVYVKQIAKKYCRAVKLKKALENDYNFMPANHTTMVKEKGASTFYPFDHYLMLQDKLDTFIRDVDKVCEMLPEDYLKVFQKTFMEGDHYWWNEEGMSTSTYYRKRRKFVTLFMYYINILHQKDLESFVDDQTFDCFYK